MIRPKLNEVSLEEGFKSLGRPGFVITMSIGQWDNLLEEGYYRQGAILIELDENEIPVAIYKFSGESIPPEHPTQTEQARKEENDHD